MPYCERRVPFAFPAEWLVWDLLSRNCGCFLPRSRYGRFDDTFDSDHRR